MCALRACSARPRPFGGRELEIWVYLALEPVGGSLAGWFGPLGAVLVFAQDAWTAACAARRFSASGTFPKLILLP